MSLQVNFLSGVLALSLDEVVLLLESLGFLVADLLLAVLGLVVVFFAHAVEVVLHLFFLATHFLNGCHLLVSEVPVPEQDLLLLLLLALASIFSILLFFVQTLLLLTLPHQHLVVILILQLLELACFFLRLIDLLDRPDLFVLKHPHSVA